MTSRDAPGAFLEVDEANISAEALASDGRTYLEVEPLRPEQSDAPTPKRRKVRSAGQPPAEDDSVWVAVVRALNAERALLAALWPSENARDLLREPPTAEAFAARCEEARRAFDAIGRRDADSRARAEVAQRVLRRQLEELEEAAAPRDAAIRALERAQINDLRPVLQLLAGETRVIVGQDVQRFYAAAAERGISWHLANDLAREVGVEVRERETRPAEARSDSAPSASAPVVEATAVVTAAPPLRSAPGPSTAWHFAHLGESYFEAIADLHRASGLPPIKAVWTGRLGVSYDQKALGRQVNPNWMIEVEGGATYTKRGGLSLPDTYTRANMYRWSWLEVMSRFAFEDAPKPRSSTVARRADPSAVPVYAGNDGADAAGGSTSAVRFVGAAVAVFFALYALMKMAACAMDSGSL